MNSYISMKYQKKIRLLVTNKCSRNCPYCHNEGMPKKPYIHLNPQKIEPFLPDIKKYSNRIVLSGGEPFEYDFLGELTSLLIAYGFDISIITANINRDRLKEIGFRVKTLHYSIHGFSITDADRATVLWMNKMYPNIRLSLNVPFTDINTVKSNWDKLLGLASEIGANIQLIRVFTPGVVSKSSWDDRWKELSSFLAQYADYLEGTERERRYLTPKQIKVDLLDIPCLASGVDFDDGACLYNSDITIDPSLKLTLCRWAGSGIDLYEGEVPIMFDSALDKATKSSCLNCLYGKRNAYPENDRVLGYFMNAPHYSWPNLSTTLDVIFKRTFSRDFSYYGKSGTVLNLENEFSRFVGMDYSLAVNSGTTATYLACKALQLKEEDEVVISVATFPTLISALLTAGLKVRLCDVDPLTGNISTGDLQKQMGPNVKAVLITHLWGLPADMDGIVKKCREHGAYLIEDCSHAYGAKIDGKPVGSFGDISVFSLQANKAVYAGEGGMLVTSNRQIYESAVTFSASVERILDCVKNSEYLKYWSTGLGLKLKINPLGAPLALMSLRELERVNQNKQERMSIIEETIRRCTPFLVPDEKRPNVERTYYTYKLVLKDDYIPLRNEILRAFIHRGLDMCVTSFIPAYKHEISTDIKIVNGTEKFQNAEKYYSRIISMPAFVFEPIELVKYYAKVIEEISTQFSKTTLLQ